MNKPLVLLTLLVPLPAMAKLVCPLKLAIPVANSSYTCGFAQMPIYNQLDPNLAYVNVPDYVYTAEVNDGIAVSSTGNPYYKSWEPLGPAVGDPGSIGYTFSNTCGAVANAMAYEAALLYRSPSTKVVSGSWTDVDFVQAQKPAGQEAFPNPLYQTNHAGSMQMTLTGLQRLVNMFTKTNAMPVPGGGWFTQIGNSNWPWYLSFAPFVGDLQEVGGGAGATYETVTSWTAVPGNQPSVSITNQRIENIINAGGTGSLHHSTWTVHITNTKNGLGVPTQVVTFTNVPESHYVALQGYTLNTDANLKTTMSITYNDPAFGVQSTEPFVDLSSDWYTRTGVVGVRVVELPNNASDLIAWPVNQTFCPIFALNCTPHPALHSVWDLYDGEQIEFGDELYVVYVK
jgi:hypothetical protein